MTRSDRQSSNMWDTSRYDGSHSFVYEYGEDLLELLDPTEDERILDLGCGTGHLTGEIQTSGATVVGLDQSMEMIAEARSTYPECEFVCADAQMSAVDDSFDAVFSNAALHWIDDQDAALKSVADALKPNGRFVAELGGAGNVERITDSVRSELRNRGYDVDHPWYFPSIGEYASRLEDHGFEVQYATLFDRPTTLEGADGLESWLRMFGDHFFEPLSPDEQAAVIAAVEDDLRDELFRDGGWIADYRRLRFVAVTHMGDRLPHGD
ncbi:SAM-dependent methyltransferase [Natrinema sp. CBA1119]|uniref:class I SAM-dependent methyltransferase n=1 Tax=Natrinema sp. CBA1119 TaxID=1608465 RepID=UPI000BF5635F|nr:class I SAM-dependent methyltransferase [Natrinema sp. CBA1119]PGF13843.1 SAM-dependent methyltransferase [Natrinema sp. CBA1119]